MKLGLPKVTSYNSWTHTLLLTSGLLPGEKMPPPTFQEKKGQSIRRRMAMKAARNSVKDTSVNKERGRSQFLLGVLEPPLQMGIACTTWRI